jgi:hypothetical protein
VAKEEEIIIIPMIEKRNWGHCQRGSPYFLHWAKILNCSKISLNFINLIISLTEKKENDKNLKEK